MKCVIVFAVVFVISQIVFCAPQFEIIQGNCTGITNNNKTWTQEDHKSRIPFMTREGTAYIKSFTAALRFEYGGDGITIQHLAPMFVNTKMNAFSDKLQKNSFFVPDAEEYAKYAVLTLGKIDESSGYWTHGIQTFFTKLPPVWLRMYIGAYLNYSFRQDYFRQRKSDNNNLKSDEICER